MNTIKVYGANWCEDTTRTREQLDALGVKYQYIDIDKDAAAKQWITKQNHGKQKTPTVDVGGKILIEPTNEEMEDALRKSGALG
jgi:glutaredoxin